MLIILSIINGKSLGGEGDSRLREILVSPIKRLHREVGRGRAAAPRYGSGCRRRGSMREPRARRSESGPADRAATD